MLCSLLAATVLVCIAAGCSDDQAGPPPVVATSNTYLQAAVWDLIGRDVPVMSLAGPGACPGHFDLKPSDARRLGRVPLLLSLPGQDDLARAAGPDTVSAVVPPPGGLGDPNTYLGVCRRVSKLLAHNGLVTEDHAAGRLERIEARMASLRQWMRQELAAAGLEGAPVVAPAHQVQFCRAAGLRVIAVYTGSDTTSTGEIGRVIAAADQDPPMLVIANRPQGRKLADALAGRLGDVPVAVLCNFPDPDQSPPFDEMVRTNVGSLIEAATP